MELSPPNSNSNPNPSPCSNVALVVGVTGMVGSSLVNALKKPTAAGSPWAVYGLARRTLPAHFPAHKLDRFIKLDVLDRAETLEALGPLARHVTHLFWVAMAKLDTDEATCAANSAMLTNVLDALTCPTGSPLRHVALQTGTMHYYYGLLGDQARAQINLHVPFREGSPHTSCRLFYYDLEDILVNYPRKLTWTVHRPSLILGASDRSSCNVILTLAVYALICKHERVPFLYPGSMYTWRHFCDVSDADLIADQQVWAGTTPSAMNQAFNCVNGDVFTWRSFWKILCDLFRVEFVERGLDERVSDWSFRMMGKGPVWAEVVEEFGLRKTKLEEITCFQSVWTILNFEFQHVSCMNKSWQFGFSRNVDTLKSVKKWVFKLKEMNIIPKV